jgi:hypothetical protein
MMEDAKFDRHGQMLFAPTPAGIQIVDTFSAWFGLTNQRSVP